MRVACTEAHRLDLRAEQVLILMKDLCSTDGNSRVLRLAEDGRSAYDNLVTDLVSQYYQL
ncbi:MAG: hypothetical protein ABI446_11340 [Gemmatimonadaceae bacterium]